jgi:hypothetical protein
MYVSANTKRKNAATESTMVAVVHVPLNAAQKEKLAEMAAADRRRFTEFMRILVEDEWDRRQKVVAGDGAQA